MKISGKLYRILIKALIVLVVLVAVGTIVFLALQISGRNRLYQRGEGRTPDMSQVRVEAAGGATVSTEAPDDTKESDNPPKEEDNWQEGDVRYQGVHYRYNEDILTFLFLGIDEMGEVKVKKDGILGGQSDAIFLLAMDSHAKKLSIIGVNRDTMTELEIYDKNGRYVGTTKGQLTLQHGYGDGAKISCERSVAAVEKLFYGLPIHGYCAINMGAIPLINDAVGGVELTALEDIPQSKIKKGQTILLKGKDAYNYLHNRDTKSFNSAGRRLERQKQYLNAYAATAKEAMKSDITLPVKLYSTLSKYMVTDITVDEVSYLATQALDYKLDREHIYSLAGETVEGERFEEFYVDEEALYELILEVFYEVVE